MTAATIRTVGDGPDRAAFVDIVNTITPDDPTALDQMDWEDATYPDGERFLARLGDRVVGAATTGRIYVHPPEYPDAWASLVVSPEVRQQGIGGALLATVSAVAAAAGKTGLQLRAWEHRPEGIAFLEHRGFRELERARMVRLSLAGLTRPTVTPPDGVHLTTLAEHPELVARVHDIALETFADIPGGDEPMAAGDLAEFRARDVDRPSMPADAFFVAVDDATGDAVAYASLIFLPGSTTVAWHDMTAVRRTFRGRGLATTLKEATIGWAIDHGLEALETGNDVDNAPMRAVNARLGYAPLPDELTMRGPLVGVPVSDGAS